MRISDWSSDVCSSDLAVAASYTGTGALEARAESQVVAKTSGIAMEVFAEEGDHVEAGQVLVRLDADRARLQAAQSAAKVRKLEAHSTRAKQLAAQQKAKIGSAAGRERVRQKGKIS